MRKTEKGEVEARIEYLTEHARVEKASLRNEILVLENAARHRPEAKNCSAHVGP